MPFFYTKPSGTELPIIFSSPHSGREVPPEVMSALLKPFCATLPDTDFDVDKLYGFTPSMGCHLLCAKYNRYVIDLNRPPNSEPLYKDGRRITGLVPTTTFSGDSLYSVEPDSNEIANRIEKFHTPYHAKISQLIKDLKTRHPKVVLFECHSISRQSPGIQKDPLPDLMIGTDDGNSIPKALSEKIHSLLSSSGYTTVMNSPFKGGFITRNYHDLTNGVYSIQLEMSKDLYLDEDTNLIDSKKSAPLQKTLKEMTDLICQEIS